MPTQTQQVQTIQAPKFEKTSKREEVPKPTIDKQAGQCGIATKSTSKPKLLKTKDVCEMLQVSDDKLRDLLADPMCDLPFIRLGDNGHYRFHPVRLEEWMMNAHKQRVTVDPRRMKAVRL